MADPSETHPSSRPDDERSIESMVRGRSLAALRTLLGVQVNDLAAKTGFDESTIYNYERGVTSPDRERLGQLLGALGVSLRHLARTEEWGESILRPKGYWGASTLNEVDPVGGAEIYSTSGRSLVESCTRAAQRLILAAQDLAIYFVDRLETEPRDREDDTE
jgi:transcriptional regulator with XRE-family HTH domain